jgi:exopolysaccharide biosynthesis polyprenyl glycosylphosphotransferase
VLGSLEAQRIAGAVAVRVMPALVGGAIAYRQLGRPGAALILGLCLLAALQLTTRSPLPLGLMPASRFVVGLLAPLVGAGLALALCLAAGEAIPLWAVRDPVLGCWVALVLGTWVKLRFETSNPVRVAVLGSPGFASDLADELETAGTRGYELVGWFGEGSNGLHGAGLPRLGTLDDVRWTVLRTGIELLVCAPDVADPADPDSSCDVYALVTDACLDLEVRMIGANQFYEDLLGQVPMGTIDATWFRYIMHPRFRSASRLAKRSFDLLVAGTVAILSLPMVGIAMLAIKLTDGGAVLYRQRRVGEKGRVFTITKLRTMVEDAEAAGPRWSGPDDERVTRLGRFLRGSHIDELPQLWNVLRNDMSLVGPRPERPEIVAEIQRRFPHYSPRHLIKPGITGWAQLRCGYGGSEIGTAWKLCHDLFYLKHRSFLVDLLILVETAITGTRGARRTLRLPRRRFVLGTEMGAPVPVFGPTDLPSEVADPEPGVIGHNGHNGHEASRLAGVN